jgi:hypothetical protein
MNPFARALLLTLGLTSLAWAQTLEPTRDWSALMSFHTAVPTGGLHQDVQGQLGFGFGLGAQLRVSNRIALRGSFSWTGFRVDERNLWSRMVADLFDASYTEDRLVLRSYALGVDVIGFTRADGYGPYMVAGVGLQRSRLYAEAVYVDSEGNQSTQDLGTWPPADTPFFQVGLGHHGRSGVYVEGKAVGWRYRAMRGYPLLESPLGGETVLRDALSLTLSLGARF